MSNRSFLNIVRSLVMVFALAIACGAAHADETATYDITGTFASGGTLSGSFTFDYNGITNTVTVDSITADGVTFANCPNAGGGKCVVYTSLYSNTQDGFGEANNMSTPYLNLNWLAIAFPDLPATLTLSDTTQCVDCGTNGMTPYGPNGGYYDNLVSGTATLVPPTATPEGGSSLVMLLAGLLSLGIFASWQMRRGNFAAQAI